MVFRKYEIWVRYINPYCTREGRLFLFKRNALREINMLNHRHRLMSLMGRRDPEFTYYLFDKRTGEKIEGL